MKRFFQASWFIPCVLVMSVMFTAISCSKDGDPGPAGPAGPNGPAGPAGPAGPKGDTGTANVIYSGWLDVTFEQDTATGTWIASLDAPQITPEVLAGGEIKVYMNLRSADNPLVAPLPYFDGENIINVRFVEGLIGLLANGNLSTVEDDNGVKYQQARYIVIPGGTSARKAAAGIDWNNYEQVKAWLHLKD